MKKLFLLLALLLACGNVQAAIKTISDTGGNWGDTATWGGAAIPTTSDTVVAQADGTSGPVTINATNQVCSILNLENYTNTMTFSPETLLTVTTTTKFNSGMTITGTGNLQLQNTATITSAGKNISGNLIFNGGTWTLADDWNVTGNISVIGSSTFVNNNFYAFGGLNHTGTSTWGGTTNVTLKGTGTVTGIAQTFNSNLTIDTPGTITFSGLFLPGQALTYVSGTVVTTGAVVQVPAFAIAARLDTDGIVWDQFGIRDDAILNSNLTCKFFNQTLSAVNITGNGYFINITENASFVGLDWIGDGGVVLTGTGYIDATGGSTTTGYHPRIPITINSPAGTINIHDDFIYEGNTFTYIAGNITGDNTSIGFHPMGNVTFNTSGMTFPLISTTKTANITLLSDFIADKVNLYGALSIPLSSTAGHINLFGNYNTTISHFKMGDGATLSLSPGAKMNVSTSLYLYGGINSSCPTIINSTVESTAANFSYMGTIGEEKVFGITFQDIDASGSAQAIDDWYGGVLTRTTNINNRTISDLGEAPPASGSGGYASPIYAQ
ncbi:MAG: hypothetical protein ABFC84_16630 [Veillonellales bacterium]